MQANCNEYYTSLVEVYSYFMKNLLIFYKKIFYKIGS
jgi:hypothetical protein